MNAFGLAAILVGAIAVTGCVDPADAQSASPVIADGAPYVLNGTQVWSVPDPVSGRDYEVFVSLPASYGVATGRRFPVLYVTDADYAFPLIRSIARRVNLDGPVIEDFILVGLSYSRGDSGADSRRRDYTPVPRRPGDTTHGQGPDYQAYLKAHALPFIEGRFRADPARRIFLGHSYGALLGSQILLTQPGLFDTYILGSPSFWFGDHQMLKMEADYALTHRDLPADVFMYIGGFETVGDSPRHNRTRDMVGDVALFQRRLESHGYPGLKVQSVVLEDEDHLTVAPVGFTRALMATLPAR